MAHMRQPLKRHLDRFSRICVHRSKDSSLLMLFGEADNPQNFPFPLGNLNTLLIHGSLNAP